MIRFEFNVEDLARTRFAISPMWEAVASLRMLLDPGRGALHLAWMNEVRDGRLSEVDLRTLAAMLPARGYIPDFLTPPPTGPLAEFEDELDTLRRTPAAQVRHDVDMFLGSCAPSARRSRRVVEALGPLRESPRRALAALAESLAGYWGCAVEPHWPRIRALLGADIAHRAAQLTAGGPQALFEDLHPLVGWREPRLEVENQCDEVVPLRGQGLLMMPSAFGWERTAAITGAPWQPTLIYPARGLAMLWEPGDSAPDGVAALVGRTRAELLAALDAPRSTTELAACLGVSPGGASQHLSVLRAAGLVTGRRDGRSVLYCRTPLADSLVTGVAS